jgi:hypothetical protein
MIIFEIFIYLIKLFYAFSILVNSCKYTLNNPKHTNKKLILNIS